MSVSTPISKTGNAKECSNYHTIALISYVSKVMLKTLQVRLQQYVNQKLPDVQVGFPSSRRTRDPIASVHWIMEKVRSQKSISFYSEAFDCVDHSKLGDSSGDRSPRPLHLSPEKL